MLCRKTWSNCVSIHGLSDLYHQSIKSVNSRIYDEGCLELAMDEYSKAIELDPNFVDAYYNRGFIYMDLGHFDPRL